MPGPPIGNPLIGQFASYIKEEPAAPQTRWAKQYGPVVRSVGPIGLERVFFTKPEALHKILVSEWLDNPRVSASPIHTVEWGLIQHCSRVS